MVEQTETQAGGMTGESRTAIEWFKSPGLPRGVNAMSLTFGGKVRIEWESGDVCDYSPDEIILMGVQ